jgi:uncharacterized protein YbcI
VRHSRDNPFAISHARSARATIAPAVGNGDGVAAETEGTGARSPMLELSNAIVRVYKEAFGRGPTRARAHFAGPDTLVVVLEKSMTVAERNLAQMDEHERIRDARLFFQHSLEAELRAVVQNTLGRRPVAFISGIDPRVDVAVEVFVLEPSASANGAGAFPSAAA